MLKHNKGRFYGLYSNFNPKLIVLQIICMEALFYLGLSMLFIVFDNAFGLRFHIGQFFHHSTFNTEHLYGTISIMSYFLNIPIIICGLVFVVVKANKVLDFISTIFIFHLALCLYYNGIRFFSVGWFVINGICFLINVIVGEYVCIRFEQQEIKIFENIINKPTSNKLENSKQQSEFINISETQPILSTNNNNKIQIKEQQVDLELQAQVKQS